MRTYLICIISCILYSISINAQEKVLLDFEGKSVMFQGWNDIEFRGSLSGQTYANFCNLLNEDIFRYYDIEDCETALLKEEFSNSQEGKKLSMQLSELKKSICSEDIYYVIPFSIGSKREYNLKTGCFDFKYVVDDNDFISQVGYINFPDCAFKTSKLRQSVYKSEWYNYPGKYSYHITISFPIPKTTALLVEKNIDDAALVVSFNSPQARSNQLFDIITGVATNFLIINIKTNEIYYSLDKNKLKELQIKQEKERQIKLVQERERQRQIEEQEKARKAKEKADSLAAVSKIKEYVEKIDSSIIRASIKKYNDEKYRKNTIVLRTTLPSKNKSGLPVFSTYIEQYLRISLLIDSVATKVIAIDTPVQLSNKKEYIVDGNTYKPYKNGFVNELYVKSKLYAGYSNGIIMQKKKGNVTYKGVTGDYADKEINKEEIPSLVASKLQELIKTDGKYRVEYVFAEDRILSLSITKGKKLIYRQTYDSGGHLHKSGTLLTNPK